MHMPCTVGRVGVINLLFPWKKDDDVCSQRQYQKSNEQSLLTTVYSNLIFEWVLFTEVDR